MRPTKYGKYRTLIHLEFFKEIAALLHCGFWDDFFEKKEGNGIFESLGLILS